MAAPRWAYGFGGGATEGDASMRDLLGGKGANLAEMAKLGLPVPPGFTLTTEVCDAFYQNDRAYPDGMETEVAAALKTLEAKTGRAFGDAANPLLVSVRSGARVSMPGMMDTVLNLGLNDETVKGLAEQSGDERFAYDSYRRFIQMYSEVVLGLEHGLFEHILGGVKDENEYASDTELTVADLKRLVADYKRVVAEERERPFPVDPMEQLWGAIGAVFDSWQSRRAADYRRIHDIPDAWGTAVTVQAMVFGNMGSTSATGVAFTRDPSTGEKVYYGEYLLNAQGEDVVAGIRTPKPITRAARERAGEGGQSLEEALPDAYAQLVAVFDKLESHYRDMQDIEFTVERGALYMLQTRAGKRTARAALKLAVDMVGEGLITREEAVARIEPGSLDQLLHKSIAPDWEGDVIVRGLPASPGAAVGVVVFDPDEAKDRATRGEDVILIRDETSPEDIHGMHAARAIVTARGGMTSHAAVVARGMGRPCVCGAGEMRINERAQELRVGDRVVKRGEVVTVDGSKGVLLAGPAKMVEPELGGDFSTLMEWADGVRRLKVRGNCDTPEDVAQALRYGGEGVGLCRTEHMFFGPERIAPMREMLLADDEAGRIAALKKVLPFQRADFEGIFTALNGLPATIRLLDPPLHEFLPKTSEEVAAVVAATGVAEAELLERARKLAEANPMLGFRGGRLAIVYPEIADMQARAIFEAAVAVKKKGIAVAPEIMAPFIVTGRELDLIKARIDRTAQAVFAETGARVDYTVGTMIELPRAALRADEIGARADFFSFGTNDLTQTALGLSRDDAGRFLPTYVDRGIFERDPFVSLDAAGVGELVRMAAERGRAANPGLKLGLCGEHGGDAQSVRFCHEAGLDYVSCSPFRIPVARLAAAQAALAG